jgi:MinD-like ATPase involved in chromosome partitioning or flagellar assembly
MGYQTKIQLIKRAKGSDQYYVNFPMVMAEALEFVQGEVVEWTIAESGELILSRPNSPKRTTVKKTKEKIIVKQP